MMFDSAEKKLNNLEFRVSELEKKLKPNNTDDYNLKVLKYGLTCLGVITIVFGFTIWIN